ncbi:hypothetical protein AB0K00_31165 [Dactylosporangium sp. NPDC049525]|uniref:hypothetical protein n=1 Tax=Dactylosporangium sp. NPDC049525 TaxID=3154730 RepID=UPI0034205357
MMSFTGSSGRIATRIGVTVAGLAMALGVAVGLDAAPAQAKTIHASLSIGRSPEVTGKYRVTMNVWIPMNEYDSHGYYNNGARMEAHFEGDDGSFHPLLVVFPRGSGFDPVKTWVAGDPGYTAESDGIHLRFTFLAPGSELDEDPADWLRNQYVDDVYFSVWFIDGDDGASGARSNVVHQHFCCKR